MHTTTTLTEAAKRNYVSADKSPAEKLLSAYWFHRASNARFSATYALHLARADVAAGKPRYASSPWRKPVGNGKTTSGAQWIETPASMGLRFVGYCDEIYDHVGHTGWYADEFQDSTIRGVVYQLPGRDGKSRFVAGHDNPDNGAADNGGPAYVDFSTVYESDFESEMRDALRSIGKSYQTPAMLRASYWAEAAHESARKEAARAANDFAERMAEQEREYDSAWQAGSAWSDERDEIAQSRALVRKLLAERRQAKAAAESYPTICETLAGAVRTALADMADSRKKMERLAAGDGIGRDMMHAFYPSAELKAAFNDGAGRVVLLCVPRQ